MFIKDPDLYVGSGAGQKSSGTAALGKGKNIIQNIGRKKGQKLVNYRRSDQQSLFLPVQRKCMFTFSNKQRQNNCILNLQKKYLNKKLFLTVTKGLNKSTTATHLLFLQTSSTRETVRQIKRKTVKMCITCCRVGLFSQEPEPNFLPLVAAASTFWLPKNNLCQRTVCTKQYWLRFESGSHFYSLKWVYRPLK